MTALILAMTFVVLGVLLNAMISAETMAVQERHAEATGPIRYLDAAESGLGGSVFFTNYYDRGDVAAFRAEHAAWTANASPHLGVDGVAAGTDLLGTVAGAQVFQNSSRQFTDADGAADWTLATGLSGVRRFTLNVSRDELADPGAVTGAVDLLSSDAFRVRADNGSAVRTVVVYRDGSDVVVEVVNETGASPTIVGSCRTARAHAVIDLTQGRLGRTPCGPLDFPHVGGTYAIEYDNGDRVRGRYVLVVDRRPAGLPSGKYGPYPGGDPPHALPALYSVTLEVDYRSASLSYATNLTVAPAEPPPGKTFGVAPAPIEVVYTSPSGRLHTVRPGGAVTTYAPDSTAVVGPMEVDFDGDGRLEIPYVNASGDLKLVDRANETQHLATGAATSTTLLGVGTWGNATFRHRRAVYYVNTTDGAIYRAWFDESTNAARHELVLARDGDGDGISAVGGIGDFNEDGDADVVFVDGSAQVTYLDGATTHETGTTIGQNNGVGIGEPRVFENGIRVPIVDTSGNVGLLRHDGSVTQRTTSGDGAKAPVAGVNWDASADGLEVLYVGSSEGHLHYVTQSGTKVEITDASGDPIDVDDDQGVA